MSEQQTAELGKTLGILVERIEGLTRRVDDLRQHVDTRLDDAQKLSTWVLGLLCAICPVAGQDRLLAGVMKPQAQLHRRFCRVQWRARR